MVIYFLRSNIAIWRGAIQNVCVIWLLAIFVSQTPTLDRGVNIGRAIAMWSAPFLIKTWLNK